MNIDHQYTVIKTSFITTNLNKLFLLFIFEIQPRRHFISTHLSYKLCKKKLKYKRTFLFFKLRRFFIFQTFSFIVLN